MNIMVSNGDVHPAELCVELHDGTWELKSDCTLTDMEQEWCLNDDVHTEYFGSTFIEGNNDIAYSEYHDEWIDTENHRCQYGYVSRREQGYFCRDESIECRGEVYADSDVASDHDVYWSDRMGEYYNSNYDDDDDDQSSNNADYQSLSRSDKSTGKTIWRVGFEVEKEDDDACGIHYREVYDRTGWGKENDGSLDSCIGYELVSPTFDLFTNDMDNDIKADVYVDFVL